MNSFFIKSIDKILSYRYLKIFLSFSFCISIVVSATFLYGMVNALYNRDIPMLTYTKITITFLGTILPFIIITSTVFSSIFISIRLETSLELCALKSIGVSFFKIICTLFKVVLFISILVLFSSHYIVPHSLKGVLSIGSKIFRDNPTVAIKPKMFIKDFQKVCFYVDKKISENVFSDVIIYRNGKNKNILSLAKKAQIKKKDNDSLQIIMTDGVDYIESFDENGQCVNSLHVAFKVQTIFFSLKNMIDFLDLNENNFLLKDSFQIYNFIRQENAELQKKIKSLREIEFKEKEDIQFSKDVFIMSPPYTKQEPILAEMIANKILEEIKKENIASKEEWLLVKKKIKKQKREIEKCKQAYRKTIYEAQKNLTNRDSYGVACVVLFLLCFAIGFLLRRRSFITPLLLGFFIAGMYCCLIVFFTLILRDVLDIYISSFAPILIFLPLVIICCYHANKDAHKIFPGFFKKFFKRIKEFIKVKIKTLFRRIKKEF